MPPRERSRHIFTKGTRLDDLGEDELFLTERKSFPFEQLSDSEAHVVEAGDTLWTLAGRYYRGLPRPSGLWWVIADFQPQPIHDPTVELAVGSIVVVPSLRVVEERVFSSERRLTG